jgi:hypothetical protein
MAQRRTSIFLSVVMLTFLWGERSSPARAKPADQCIPAISVTSSVADEEKTGYKSIYDGNPDTFLKTSAKGWHFVQFDFGCDVELTELRRYMTRDGKRTDGARTALGEGILHSRDGIAWFEVTNKSSEGWNEAAFLEEPGSDDVRYRGFAWHSLSYGWSPSLALNKPILARYVRYNWNVANDRFNELQMKYERPAILSRLDWDWSSWDWAAPDAMVLVRYDSDSRSEEDRAQAIDLPWNDAYGPCREEHPDVDPANGWVLVAGNFGTDLFTQRPDYPYFVLYNKYRGMMRSYVFYGSRLGIPHMATHQMGTLTVEDGDVAAFTHFTGKYLFDYNPRYEQIFMKKRLVLDHWACLEFDVTGYDPDISDASKAGASFLMAFQGLEQSVLDADIVGGLDGTLEASNVRMGKDGLSGAFDAVATAGGDFLKAVSIYADVQSALDAMEAKGNANAMTWWGPVLAQAAALGSQNTVPLIAAAAGFITNLIDGGGEGNVPLSYRTHLTGEFRVNGTIQTAPTLSLVPFYVPGTIYGTTPELQPFYHEPLGIYSLAWAPVLEWWSAPSGMAQQLGGTRGVGIAFDASSVIVNPASGLQLHSIRVGLVSPSYAPRAFTDPATYVGLPLDWMTTTQFNSLKVGVRLQFARIGQPSAPLVTLYREYEPTREWQGVYGL